MPPSDVRSPLLIQLQQFVEWHPTARKVVFVPQRQFGRALEDALARQSGGWVGLSSLPVARYAQKLARLSLLARDEALLPSGGALFLAAHAAGQLSEAQRHALQVEGQTRLSPGTVQALALLFQRLRKSGIAPSDFRGAASTARRRAEATAYASYVELLDMHQYADAAAVLEQARHDIESGHVPVENTAFAVLDEVKLTRLETRLLYALRDAAPAFYRIGSSRSASVPPGRAGQVLQAVDSIPAPDEPGDSPTAVGCDTAVGAEQEVRAVFRDLLTKVEEEPRLTFDQVEIAYTDPERYLPLLLSMAARHNIPVSVSVGVSLDHTRPGQAASAWLAWIREDLAAPRLIRMLRGGLLRIDRLQDGTAPLSAHRAATLLASMRYEPGRTGYRKAMDRKIEALAQEKVRLREHAPEAAAFVEAERKAWIQLQQVMDRVLALVPSGTVDVAAMAASVAQFLIQLGPVDRPGPEKRERTVDEAARNRLIDQMQTLAAATLPGRASVRAQAGRLAQLIGSGRVKAERPQPGMVFLVPLESAGFAGRAQCYVVGLDSESVGRYLKPTASPVTPRERDALKDRLGDPLHALDESADSAWAIRRARRRHGGPMRIYARTFDLRDGEPRYPSTLFLEWGGTRAREMTGDDGDHEPAGIRSLRADDTHGAGLLALDPSEDWLAAYMQEGTAQHDALFSDEYPCAAQGLRASQQRASDRYTAYDGLLRDGEYPELDILGNQTLSPSRLETLAATPYLYFLEHILQIQPLDEPALDDLAWLDALRRGRILHDTFDRFMRAQADGLQADAAEDRLDAVLRDRLEEAAQQLAPPNAFIKQTTLRRLRADAHVFLQAERAEDTDATPHRFEFGFGLPPSRQRDGDAGERAAIDVGGGAPLFLRGRIDRIDRHPEGALSIWDYKTGRATSFSAADPLQQGKTMQWALYGGAMESLLGATVKQAGYFFTSTKEMGRRIAAPPHRYRGELNAIIRRLSALARSGTFPMVSDLHEHNGWAYSAFARLHPDLKERARTLREKTTWDESERPLPAHLLDE